MATSTPPVCFGKSWEAKAVQCQGGLDPAYVNPQTGSNRRDRCAWYTHCASRTSAYKLRNPQQQLVPVQQVVRRPAPAQPQPMAPQPSFMQPVHQAAMTFANGVLQGTSGQPQVQYAQPAPVMVHPAMASTPWAVPMNYPIPGAQMPSYLTVPEPVVEGRGWGLRLFLNVVRAMVKGGSTTVANFVDHTPIQTWPQPPAQPPAQPPPTTPTQ